LDISNLTRAHRGRPLAVALAASFVLALPLAASAQDAEESPVPETSMEAEVSSPAAVADEGLAFPVMLGGQLLSPQTYTGSEWLEQFSGDEPDTVFLEGTQALLDGAGASIDDLTVKSALYEPVEGEAAVALALRIAGTDARDWVRDAVHVLLPDIVEPGLVMRPLGTKWVLRVTDASMPGVYPRTVYLKDDTAWFVQGDDYYVEDALGQLPDANPVGESSADTLYTDMPIALGGQRRTVLYESTEPFFAPYTLSDRLGSGFEDWLLDLYLEARLSPEDLLGVIAWWGLPGLDGLQIEGYRLPEGGEELTQRLLNEIFLIRPPDDASVDAAADVDPIAASLAGVEFREEEIAGQPVTTLDYGNAVQYIFSTADTIWVIGDPLGERDKVVEAIEALP
jgi:hypothetical protein